MNNLTRRFASPGNLFAKRIQSFAGVRTGPGASSVGSPFEREDNCQHRRFGSISRGHDYSTVLNSLSHLSIGRGFSSNATAAASNNVDDDQQQLQQLQQQQQLSPTSPTMFTDSESGEKYGVLLDTRISSRKSTSPSKLSQNASNPRDTYGFL